MKIKCIITDDEPIAEKACEGISKSRFPHLDRRV